MIYINRGPNHGMVTQVVHIKRLIESLPGNTDKSSESLSLPGKTNPKYGSISVHTFTCKAFGIT